jgi:hypothetical protein
MQSNLIKNYMSWYILPKSIISYIKSFFGIIDNIKIQLINNIWYSTKYTIIDVIMYDKNKNEVTQYITNKTFFQNIEHLYLLDIKNITNDIINLICNLTKLQKLHLKYSNITNDNIRLLLKGKNIYDLNIYHSKNLTNDFMYFIPSLTNLQNLNLSYCCNITEKGISYLSYCTNLVNLNLSDFCKTNDSLIHISCFKNLEKLDISNNELDFDNIKYLINNKKLNTLYISPKYEEDIKQSSIFKTINIIYKYSYFIHICFLFI